MKKYKVAFLVSIMRERHEDRIPLFIVREASYSKINSIIEKHAHEIIEIVEDGETDYDKNATVLITKSNSYVVEKFELQ